MTQGGADPLPLEEEHCSVVEVTEEEVKNSVKFVPSLSAVVRRTLLHPHSYSSFLSRLKIIHGFNKGLLCGIV